MSQRVSLNKPPFLRWSSVSLFKIEPRSSVDEIGTMRQVDHFEDRRLDVSKSDVNRTTEGLLACIHGRLMSS